MPPVRITGKARRINLHAAVHVIGVLPAIEQEGALVNDRASHAAIGRDAGLEGDEGHGVAVNRRPSSDSSIAADGAAHGGVQGLEFGARGGRYFHGLGNRTNLEGELSVRDAPTVTTWSTSFETRKPVLLTETVYLLGTTFAKKYLPVIVRCFRARNASLQYPSK